MRYILKEEVDGLPTIYRTPKMCCKDYELILDAGGSYASRKSAQAAMRRIMREVINVTVTILEVE